MQQLEYSLPTYYHNDSMDSKKEKYFQIRYCYSVKIISHTGKRHPGVDNSVGVYWV